MDSFKLTGCKLYTWMYMLPATTTNDPWAKLLKPTSLAHFFHLGGSELIPLVALLKVSLIFLGGDSIDILEMSPNLEF